MTKTIAWVGQFEGYGAFPIICRQLSAAMERRGWTVLRNFHDDQDGNLADVLISTTYPPTTAGVRHPFNVCMSVWEFIGPRCVPDSFLDTFAAYDLIYAHCSNAHAQFVANGVKNSVAGRIGADMADFAPTTDPILFSDEFQHRKRLLFVGGTDKRHGLDIAFETIRLLPDDYALIVKLGSYYPFSADELPPRTLVIRDDMPSLARLYAGCDALLNTVRAAGMGMPPIEALAMGLPVISTAIPDMADLAPLAGDMLTLVDGPLEYAGPHHVHPDCIPYWNNPSPEAFVDAVLASALAKQDGGVQAVREAYSWDAIAALLEDYIK